MLWLAIHLSDFPLEVVSRGGVSGRPRAVTDGRGVRQRLLICSDEAAALGLRAGMGLQAAYALVPELQILPRNETLEATALANLAAWAGQFTSLVSIEPGKGLLMEVAGSLELFGGLDELRGEVRQGLVRLGYSACLALAPTPLGAWYLAVCGTEQQVTDARTLSDRLAPLPLACLGLPDSDMGALQGMGLHCVGDLVRQPRDALARRFGQQLLDRLDKALGRLPDPRRPYRPTPRYEGRAALPAEVLDMAALLFPLHRLLLELAGYLIAVDGGIQRLRLGFVHADRAPTHVMLGLSAPSRDLPHLLELTRQRLENIVLPAPVEQVELLAEQVMLLVPQEQDLFSRGKRIGEDWQRLADRLSARLGADALRGLRLVADHRPERAWSYANPGERSQGGFTANRPLWLLAEPRLLDMYHGHPCFGSVLQLRHGPERVESGWWDGNDVVRDYYVAENRQGERLWVYREQRAKSGWFLHGIFA